MRLLSRLFDERFMAHRLRHAMASGDFLLDGTVEIDETYVGGKRKGRFGPSPAI